MRRLALPSLLVAVLALTGCVSAREVPPPMPDAEIEQYLGNRVDAAWRNTGLAGTVERPEPDTSGWVENYRTTRNYEAMFECMQDAGIDEWGMEEVDGGPVLTSGTGGVPAPPDQLAFYACFAASPTDFGWIHLTDEELDYLYDYYRDWVVPCMQSKGYEFWDLPSRQAYRAQLGGWVPYYSVRNGPGEELDLGLSQDQLVSIVDQCGAPFPGMPYNEQLGF